MSAYFAGRSCWRVKGKKVRVYICVDDTDDMTKSTSTGKIADLIAKELARLGGRMEKGITRHQLLLHDDIDYTSHNSSMCMVIDIDGVDIPEMQEVAEKVLKENMADTAESGAVLLQTGSAGASGASDSLWKAGSERSHPEAGGI